MIILVHCKGREVISISKDEQLPLNLYSSIPQKAIQELAKQFPDELLIWVDRKFEKIINISNINKIFHHNKIFASYALSGNCFLSQEIAYIDESPFVNINSSVKYPTWIMSKDIGGIYGEVLNKFEGIYSQNENFEYFLSSVAKMGMKAGLMCYSDPSFAHKVNKYSLTFSEDSNVLYHFVKQHYKLRWMALLILQEKIYQKKVHFLSIIKALCNSQKLKVKTDLKSISLKTKSIIKASKLTVDVIIPTLGRREYLYQVLKDLNNQTVKPDSVIIIEQNPNQSLKSNPEYLFKENWDFEIVYKIINQTGACNARNLAFESVKSDWVFMADDDIGVPREFIARSKIFIEEYMPSAFTVSCLQEGEVEQEQSPIQWKSFGSGCSWVKKEVVNQVKFDLSFEHGYGEDADYGMQLRNKGIDVLYNPHLMLRHIKAPIGGFRTKIFQPWEKEKITPKPSPTIMAFKIKHSTQYQLMSYKARLFIKYYKQQKIKNPLKYINEMNQRWNQSKKWAEYLLSQN